MPLNVGTTERANVSTLGSPKRPELPYYTQACALGIAAYLTGINFWTWVFTLPLFLGARADFLAFYVAGYLVRTGHRHELYSYQLQEQVENILVRAPHPTLPFYHLSYESLLFVPLSAISYRNAYFLFLSFNLALVLICFALLRPWMGNLTKVYRLFPVALFTAFLPLGAALIQGQDSVIIMALLTVSFVLLEKGQDFWAGAVIPLAAFKFQIVIPIAVIFLLWRRWGFVIGFALSLAVIILITVQLIGLDEMKVYAHWLLSISAQASATDYARNAIPPNRMPNLRGLYFGLIGNQVQNFWTQAAIFISSAALLFWLGVQNRVRKGSTALLVAIPAAALVSYHMLVHDLCILLIPIIWTLNRFIFEKAGVADGKWVVNSAALVMCAQVGQSFFPDHFYLVSIAILAFLFTLTFHLSRDRIQPEQASI